MSSGVSFRFYTNKSVSPTVWGSACTLMFFSRGLFQGTVDSRPRPRQTHGDVPGPSLACGESRLRQEEDEAAAVPAAEFPRLECSGSASSRDRVEAAPAQSQIMPPGDTGRSSHRLVEGIGRKCR